MSLAAWALLLALARMALAFLENQRTLAQTHTEARTDSLTGLKNRRSLLADLELQLELPSLGRAARAAPVRPRRLQGVQRRLRPSRRRRPAGAARRAPGRRGRTERARLPAGRRRVLRAGAPRSRRDRPARRSLLGGAHRARRGLRGGQLIRVRAAPGGGRPRRRRRCSWPTGACTPARAGAACPRAASPATCCCGPCPSGAPTFTCGSATSASWRWRSGASCTWARRGSTRWRRAAELHDVGKIAVPDAILDKPGPLDPVEWSFMRRHPADRRAHPARGAGAAPGRAACALEPRALGRRRLPGRAARRRDPARSAGRGRLRRIRRHDHRAPVPRAGDRAGRTSRSCAAARVRSSTRWW